MKSCALTILVSYALAFAGDKPTPPGQPEKGPGGAEYRHAKVTEWDRGKGDLQYWVFEPDEPKPEKAPLVVFLHGWGGMLPAPYRAWIDHLVRRGNIVVYPRYQGTLLSSAKKFDRNVYAALHSALDALAEEGHVHPDLERVAVVGHSFGGSITVNYAASAEREKLPAPKTIMVIQPGNGSNLFMKMAIEDLSSIPKGTLALVVAGEDDTVVGTETAVRYFNEMTSIPPENKDYILLRTDEHGEPALRATHFAPCCPRPGEKREFLNIAGSLIDGGAMGVDAFDWRGTWRWFDALRDAAFEGKNREQALGNTPEQRDLGAWSDGTRVREPLVTAEPK